jgi:sorbitol/mannitol transport system permease protein
MATLHTSSAARLMIAPSVVLLFAWMIVPLVMTIYFSLLNYNLLNPGVETWAGFSNYSYFRIHKSNDKGRTVYEAT